MEFSRAHEKECIYMTLNLRGVPGPAAEYLAAHNCCFAAFFNLRFHFLHHISMLDRCEYANHILLNFREFYASEAGFQFPWPVNNRYFAFYVAVKLIVADMHNGIAFHDL